MDTGAPKPVNHGQWARQCLSIHGTIAGCDAVDRLADADMLMSISMLSMSAGDNPGVLISTGAKSDASVNSCLLNELAPVEPDRNSLFTVSS